MAATHPELAKLFYPTKNGDHSPENLKAGTGIKLWWICDEGHEWKANIYSRNLPLQKLGKTKTLWAVVVVIVEGLAFITCFVSDYVGVGLGYDLSPSKTRSKNGSYFLQACELPL
jgi:hypothetical protein